MVLSDKDKDKEDSMITSLRVNPVKYKQFKMEALSRDMEISQLLEYAMELVLREKKK